MLRFFLVLTVLLLPQALLAETGTAVADDGREVRLNEDGTWEYVSEDRFATLVDGRRIRLRADGTWSPVGLDDAKRLGLTQKAGFSQSRVDAGDLAVEITGWVINKAREKRGKNKLSEAQMSITLSVAGDTSGGSLAADGLRVTDSRGREYESVAFRPVDADGNWRLTVDGAPRWWGIRFFQLEIATGVLGNPETLVLRMIRGEVVDREVDRLPEP